MAKQSRSNRTSLELKRSEINLVSARSAMSDDTGSYSRSARQGGYAKQRSKRSFKRRILIGALVTLVAVLLAGAGTAFGLIAYLNSSLNSGIDNEALSTVLVDRVAPEDPFWMLLAGTDWDEGGTDTYRADVIILARVDPGNKKAALVSIPRDTMVFLDGYGRNKINAAYTYGELEADSGNSGPAYLTQVVSDLTGANISYYAQLNFDGLVGVVDAVGGVTVEVPLDIIGDYQAGPVDVYAGEQVLDGQSALVFVRSRQYDIGDFQRQANQRTLLQALAKQILSEDPITIFNAVTQITEMTTTNMDITEIANIAMSLRGMQESDIYTYSIPSELDMFDEISYVVVDEAEARALVAAIDAGEYPDYSQQNYQGEIADRYKVSDRATDNLAGSTSLVDTTQYLVAVRNGYGIDGSATAISDMLTLAGYQQGEIGNTNSSVYETTLIIYRDDADREAAEDIRARLGYGRIIPSLGRYSFDGNVLVVVGGDFAG
ncbi:MAG: LCP family protein [Coriobacteriales bacterium]|jgi:LCP family protein required for cell wall assembly|nr:LCP family protein [Coriobacteriales bacterium]